ncbi:hypothetical protein ACIA5C_04040 [Actinoplanes sp. NPDC051343]|uniref:hypothetical protein n=1 Tax=Actinoplanes sp. NPDC051343 TaxID=3363906 RepID=UPI0037907BD9
MISTLSAANANTLGSSEIMVRLAADRQVPTAAGRLWHGHPAASVLGGAVISVILLLTGDIQTIVALGNVAAIAAMILVNAAAIRAQRRRPVAPADARTADLRGPAAGVGSARADAGTAWLRGPAVGAGSAPGDRATAGIRLPGGPLLPALGLIAAGAQLFFIAWWETLVGLVLVIAGLGLHALRGRHLPDPHAVIVDHLSRNAGPAGRALSR